MALESSQAPSAPKVESRQEASKVSDAVAAQDRRMAAAREAEEKYQNELNLRTAELREAHRQAWEQSEVADTHRQTQEAERIMRLPTPEARDALGQDEPDPTRGPSS